MHFLITATHYKSVTPLTQAWRPRNRKRFLKNALDTENHSVAKARQTASSHELKGGELDGIDRVLRSGEEVARQEGAGLS
ncbi:hypothetical protein U0070_010016 [Myodes glareolus]|uniref:Uncharacterized protein n=1 Tax=Myodes glareolus TaxID=447135 RepID=A0AAW0I2G1_MYOGA